MWFVQAYGRDLAEAHEWCKKYMETSNVKDLTQAWELYYHVFRRISKQLPQVILAKSWKADHFVIKLSVA